MLARAAVLPALLPALLVACAAARPPPYSERCDDAARPCALAYDFEPSGAAPDVFAPPGTPQFLVANEDGVLFRWTVDPRHPWDHDHVTYARALQGVVTKVESLTSAVCDGVPVVLAAANFMPGRKGRTPSRERIVALVGSLDAEPRVLEKVSEIVRNLSLTAAFGHPGPPVAGVPVKIEGLALAPGCRTLLVGVRSYEDVEKGETFTRRVVSISLDVDWAGTREDAALSARFDLDGAGCSGRPEGLSDLATLADGSLLALTSYEEETKARTKPEEVAEAKLAGTLWRRHPDGRLERLACFPGHKPEALAVMPDGKSARVLFEDDDYGGRPIGSFAVRIAL